MGKSILVSRTALNAIGGFPALQNFLAEDFLIGRKVRRAGYQIVLSADLIDTAEIRKTPRASFARHRRWAIMRGKLVGPLYLFEMFSGPLPWAIAAAAAGAWLPASLLLGLRYGTEGALAAKLGRPLSATDWLVLPVRDLFAAAVFLAGLSGRTLSWRGRPLRIGKDTRILRPAVASTGPERP